MLDAIIRAKSTTIANRCFIISNNSLILDAKLQIFLRTRSDYMEKVTRFNGLLRITEVFDYD